MTDNSYPDDQPRNRPDDNVPDPVTWLSDHPWDWKFATPDDFLIADPAARRVMDCVLRNQASRYALRAKLRRRVRWGGVSVVAALVAGGAIAVAVSGDGQPDHPESGALCRAEARVDGNAIALDPGTDPLAGCRRVWADDDFGMGAPMVPPLTACIGENGAIEVFPAEATVCQQLGLEAAAPVLAPENAAIIELQEELVTKINRAKCRPVRDVVAAAETIVTTSPLEGWRVVIEPGSESGLCGKAAVDSSIRTVTVHEF